MGHLLGVIHGPIKSCKREQWKEWEEEEVGRREESQIRRQWIDRTTDRQFTIMRKQKGRKETLSGDLDANGIVSPAVGNSRHDFCSVVIAHLIAGSQTGQLLLLSEWVWTAVTLVCLDGINCPQSIAFGAGNTFLPPSAPAEK